jgi:YD repeat-containing protein
LTQSAVTIGGEPVVVKGTATTTDNPGNNASMPNGGDVVSHGIAGTAGYQEVTSGSGQTTADGQPLSATGDSYDTNKPSPTGGMAQMTGVMVKGADTVISNASEDDADGKDKTGAKAAAPPAPGESESPPSPPTGGDPVTVATGFVVDEAVDLASPGLIPVEWKRLYSSSRFKERTSFGKGGWTHAYEQWIEAGEGVLRLRAEDGRTIYFAVIGPGESTFHRSERLTLRSDRQGSYTVESAVTGQTRAFEPVEPGGRAVLRRIQDAHGNRVELFHDAGRLVRILDTGGRTLALRHDEKGRIVRAELWSAGASPELLQWVDYAYHPEGELARATVALGASVALVNDG